MRTIASGLKRHKALTYGLSNALVAALGVVMQLAGNPDGWVRAVGQSLIGAGVVGLVFLFYTWLDLTDRAAADMISNAGLTGAFADREDDESRKYGNLVKHARHNVDILGYGLASFRQAQIVGGAPWPSNARVRILLIDPEFPDEEAPYADQRDIEEAKVFQQTRIDVEFLQTCWPHQKAAVAAAVDAEAQSRFEMKLFRCLPSVTVFRVDHVLYWGPYLMGRSNQKCPLVRVEAGGFVRPVARSLRDRVVGAVASCARRVAGIGQWGGAGVAGRFLSKVRCSRRGPRRHGNSVVRRATRAPALVLASP